jgi:hypothetical protein
VGCAVADRGTGWGVKGLQWSWEGAVAVVLAIGVACALVFAETGRHLQPDEVQLVSTALGAIVGALAGFIGGRFTKHKHGEGEDS